MDPGGREPPRRPWQFVLLVEHTEGFDSIGMSGSVVKKSTHRSMAEVCDPSLYRPGKTCRLQWLSALLESGLLQ
jgi:hypothetical protein